jgi:hypothetical protein
MLGGLFGGGDQRASSGGDTLGGPLSKAVLAGVAAVAMKKMMGGR